MHPKSGYPKLLFVIDNLSTGGAQRQLVNLAAGMKKCGYAVEVFYYTSGDLLAQPLYETNIPVHKHITRNLHMIDVIFSLRKLIDKGHFDLVLSFLPQPNFYSIFAGKFFRIQHQPVLISERSCDYPGWVSKKELIVRQLYRFVDHIIVNSHHQRLNLSAHYPAIRSRFTTIYNGYDLSYFIPANHELYNHPLKILVIASVSPYKNGLCLIKALKILKEDHAQMPQVDWIGQRVMVGNRLESLKEMEKLLKLYRLENQWFWLDQRSDIVDQLHQHDVLVHPSYVEGLPNVVCEALACARPIIVSNTLDHPRLVQDGQSGYLFDWHDPYDLANKIKAFSELSLEKRHEMGQKGRKFAEQNLSLNRYVEAYEHLFMDFLNR